MSKKNRRAITLPMLLGLSLVLLLVGTTSAAVWTDQEDYEPGSVVTISGDNSDGAGYLIGETVIVNVLGPNGYTETCSAMADEQGAWSCQVTLWNDESAVGDYSYTATGQTSGTSQSGSFTDTIYYTRFVNLGPLEGTVGEMVDIHVQLQRQLCYTSTSCEPWGPLTQQTISLTLGENTVFTTTNVSGEAIVEMEVPSTSGWLTANFEASWYWPSASEQSWFTANQLPPTLTIIKETNPDGKTGFPFTVDPGLVQLVRKWGELGSSAGQFNYIYDLSLNRAGELFVGEGNNYRIQKFDNDGKFLMTFGWDVDANEPGTGLETCWRHEQSSCKAGITGTGDGQFRGAFEVVEDANGDLYVSEHANHRIQKFDSNGGFIAKWGTYGTGKLQFRQPVGLDMDANGNLYVVELDNNRIQKLDSAGNFIAMWGWGVRDGNSEFQICTDQDLYCRVGIGGGNNGQFRRPRHIAVDSAGNVYVSDTENDRIQKFDSDGNFLMAWGWDVNANEQGTGFEICKHPDACKAGTGGGGAGQFQSPFGIAADAAGNVYVADISNYRVQKFDNNGNFLMAWGWDVVPNNAWYEFEICFAGDICKVGLNGLGDGQFLRPYGLAVDATGNVFVSDDIGNRIQKFSQQGALLNDDQNVEFTSLVPGQYLISELLPDGWQMPNISCNSDDAQVDGSTVKLTLVAGDDVICTFTNRLPNQPPTASDDAYNVDEDTMLNVTAPGILTNDVDPDGDPLTTVLSAGPAHGSLTLNSDGSFSYVPGVNYFGSDSFTYVANDGTVDSTTATVFITVNPVNDAPVANDLTITTDEDAPVDIVLSASDVDNTSLIFSIVSVPSNGLLSSQAPNVERYTPSINFFGSDSFTYQAFDGEDYSLEAKVNITVNPINDPPTADAGGPYSVNEGDSVTVAATGSDVEDTTLAFSWDLNNDGSFEKAGQSVSFPGALLDGPSAHTISVQVTDSGGLSASAAATVNIANVAPTLGAINAPIDPVPVNTAINASASFSDPGVADDHTAVWDWGDGSDPSIGDVTKSNGSGFVAGSHAYATPGIYGVTLTLTDDDGGTDSEIFQFVVVYDPDGGFVTGGGWIMSLEGAYTPDPTLTGKATFGFISKYHKGADVPTGNTEFQFKAGDLNFKSTSYDWLVVAGHDKAKYKGEGTINGAGNYGFMLTVQDNGDYGDTFRIKIWDKDNGDAVVYDNQSLEDDDSYVGTVIGGGNIKIHIK